MAEAEQVWSCLACGRRMPFHLDLCVCGLERHRAQRHLSILMRGLPATAESTVKGLYATLGPARCAYAVSLTRFYDDRLTALEVLEQHAHRLAKRKVRSWRRFWFAQKHAYYLRRLYYHRHESRLLEYHVRASSVSGSDVPGLPGSGEDPSPLWQNVIRALEDRHE